MASTPNEIFRDYVTDGVPSSGDHEPVKREIREYLNEAEDKFLAAANGLVSGATLSAINAAAATRDMALAQPGEVTTGADKGKYSWNGTTFIRIGDLIDAVALQADISSVQARVPQVSALATIFPFLRNLNKAGIWLANGLIGGKGLTPALRRQAVSDISSVANVSLSNIPIFTFRGKVLLWFKNGQFRTASGVLGQASTTAVPLATDGRTLRRFRNKVARILGGDASAKLKVAFTGDSWSEIPLIPQTLIDLLTSKVSPAATSFSQANTVDQWPGTVLTPSVEWTRQDASNNTDWPYGTGPDGQNYYTSSAGATLTISGIPGTELRFYTRKYGGTFRYRVNGGARTTVTEGTGGGLTVTTIPALADTTHTLEIDTTGNTGIVNFCGVYNVRSQKIEVIKMGNGGLTGHRMRVYTPIVSDIWANISSIDILFVNLGTNDYRQSGSTPAAYKEALELLTSMVRTTNPNCDIVFIVPPQTNGDVVVPLSQYRDVVYQHCIATGCEMLNQLDSWGTYAQEIALFDGNLHVDAYGATSLIRQLNQKVLGL